MEIFIEEVPHAVTIGIDTYSFEVKQGQPFQGIKNIPRDPSLHVVHFQHSEEGSRYGYWFQSTASDFIQFQYDRTQELFVPKGVHEDSDRRDACYKFESVSALMVPYPSLDEEDAWQELTNRVRWVDAQYSAGCSGEFVYVDSVMTTEEEKTNLTKVLAQRPGPAPAAAPVAPEPTLNYTPIAFKSRTAIRATHHMQDYLDKSYYLRQVVLAQHHRGSMYSLLGELQWSYLNAMLFGSYGSSLQWHNIIELICSSSDVTETEIAELDRVLERQLRTVPEIYADSLLNEHVWLRCLTDSFQGLKLPRTTAAAAKLLPELSDDNDGNEVEEYANNPEHTLSFSSDDDDGPVVVESVHYRRRSST